MAIVGVGIVLVAYNTPHGGPPTVQTATTTQDH
jgi:hypothetical protein